MTDHHEFIIVHDGAEDEGRFSPDDVLQGVPSSRGPSDSRIDAWIPAGGDTLRVYAAGCSGTGVPLIFFEGDVMASGNRMEGNAVVWEGYAKLSAARIQAEAERLSATLARPLVNLARPGVLGSTGDHLQRRRPRESLIVDAALEGLKRRYGWTEVDLAGFSGGGHVVAALLARRADVRNAVIASGNVAVRERLKAMERVVDVTGYHDFLDPVNLVSDVAAHPPRHVLVLTDPGDVVVSAASQTAYVKALRAAGVSVEQRFIRATDPKHHNLRNEAVLAAAGFPPSPCHRVGATKLM